MSAPALIVIDLQYDYFSEGKFPLWHADAVLDRVEHAIVQAHAMAMPIFLIRHSASDSAPFFNRGTAGAAIHARILAAASDGIVITKAFADSFHQTGLEQELAARGVQQLLICGMMTQNCVTHTALSKAAEKYALVVLGDCCTSVSEPIHQIALNALSTRVTVAASETVLTVGRAT